jgi:biotin-dependent carboxylase-like uncharacterized protein
VKTSLYGEGALFLDLELDGAPQPERAARTLAAASLLRQRLPRADVVLGAGSLAICGVGPWDPLDALIAEVAALSLGGAPPPWPPSGPAIEIEAVYDGPDLEQVAALIGATPAEVVALHAGATYRAELLGFLPGFAYLGPVPDALRLPRRASPRPRVPAGSIGVAGGFTGVYPSSSPGGWHLIARAVGAPAFDPHRRPPSLVNPGDEVRFRPVPASDSTREHPAAPPLAGPRGPGLEVLAAPACATVQDGGRPGQLRQGLPPSGPLDPSAFTAANLALGNDARAAAIEIPLGRLEVQASGRARVSIDGEPARTLQDGERLVVPPCGRAVRYLAVSGGVATPSVLGARATLLAVRLGGLAGRPLRRGDLVPLGNTPLAPAGPLRPRLPPPDDPPPLARLFVEPGPHALRFPGGALDALLSAEYAVSRLGDRVGVRLEGPPIDASGAALSLPAPMVRGAIEITPDGTPIALGPDHPTTGGYPVLAVLGRASQALLARLAPGHRLRFSLT